MGEVYLRGTGLEGEDWICLGQKRDRWPALVNMMMNLRVSRQIVLRGVSYLRLHLYIVNMALFLDHKQTFKKVWIVVYWLMTPRIFADCYQHLERALSHRR
jgi:hypothetical protein